MGRQSGRRLAASPARRDRERLAAQARAGRAFARRHGQCLRGRRCRAALRDLPRLYRRRSAEGEFQNQTRDVPVHRRGACRHPGAPAGRRGDPCPARRQGRQRDDRRRARRAERSGARLQAIGGHGRGDRRRASRAQPQRGRAAALDRRPCGRGAGRRLSVLCAGLLSAQQRLLQGMGCASRASAIYSMPG